MRRATGLIHTSEIKILLNLPSIILVLIFVNVKTLIMLMLFLEQARGRPTWSLRATWCPRALRWWPLLQSVGNFRIKCQVLDHAYVRFLSLSSNVLGSIFFSCNSQLIFNRSLLTHQLNGVPWSGQMCGLTTCQPSLKR